MLARFVVETVEVLSGEGHDHQNSPVRSARDATVGGVFVHVEPNTPPRDRGRC
jgi:hypothetical protein